MYESRAGAKIVWLFVWFLISGASESRTGGGTTKPAGQKKRKKRVKSFGGESSRIGHSSDLEDGAAPRPCHVSVRRRNAEPPPRKHSNICGLALDLAASTLLRRGWTVLHLRSNHLVKCGKCGAGPDQLHGGYSCRILCIVVRTLCRLFPGIQKPGERY